MKQNTVLIATTNSAKFAEFKLEFADLPFNFVSLNDIKLGNLKVDEPYQTLWENALYKAKTYAQKSKLLTIAEDSGIFIKELQGAPGVSSKLVAPTEKARNAYVLQKLKNVSQKNRAAYFETTACVYDPHTQNTHLFTSRVHGTITTKSHTAGRAGMGYDAIFYYPPLKKTFSELTIAEKNTVSHRGKILSKLRVFLDRQYGFKQLVVSGAMIIQNRKMLLLKRRDSRPDFNNKWEFPGGQVEVGESVEEALYREIKEETGYTVKIVSSLPHVHHNTELRFGYKAYLVLYICQPTAGKFKTADNECSGHGWFTLKEMSKLKMLANNKSIITKNTPLLKKYID